MSINRVPIGSVGGTANNQFHGQGQFCYYRKGSAVSGVTDVAVYVDSAYMGIMSPTEHFSLNTKGTFWEFKPVDPLLVGEFVLADTAEEYGSSAVAGTVAISGGSIIVSDYPKSNSIESETTTAFFGTASYSAPFYLMNPTGSGKNLYFEKFAASGNTGNLTAFNLELGTHTDNGGTHPVALQNKKPQSGLSLSKLDGSITGYTNLGTIVQFNSVSGIISYEFADAIILQPGYCIKFVPTLSAGVASILLECLEK